MFQAIEFDAGLRLYLNKSNKQIDEVVGLVRGKLTKMARTTLGALIVIDVHGNKDFILIISVIITHESDFKKFMEIL